MFHLPRTPIFTFPFIYLSELLLQLELDPDAYLECGVCTVVPS